MDPIAIPDWVRGAPEVMDVRDWHLPVGSGISGPPAGAFLTAVQAENALGEMHMWHILLAVTDEDIELLKKSKVLVLALSVVPIFQVYPWDKKADGTHIG